MREKGIDCKRAEPSISPRVKILFHLKLFAMSVKELKDALISAGIAPKGEKKAELQQQYDEAVANGKLVASTSTPSDATVDLRKYVADADAIDADSDEARNLIKDSKAKEYPDTGRDIESGAYLIVGTFKVLKWKNQRTGRESDIYVAHIVKNDTTHKLELLPFACFCVPQYKFLRKTADDYVEDEQNRILPRKESTADRNGSVLAYIAENKGRVINVKHSFGHNDNPNATRVWDFTATWCEE